MSRRIYNQVWGIFQLEDCSKVNLSVISILKYLKGCHVEEENTFVLHGTSGHSKGQ